MPKSLANTRQMHVTPSRALLTGLALLTLAGCGSSTGAIAQPGGCTSHYEPVAAAASPVALKNLLLHDIDPNIKTLRVVDPKPDDHKVTVNLLDKSDKIVKSLDMWRKSDGTWVAQQWKQCID